MINVWHIRILQLFLKHLQEKGCCEIGSNFDYSSIDEDDLFHFTENSYDWISNEVDIRPVFTSSPSRKLLDYLESISLERSDSSLPFNRKLTSSSCDTKLSTSLAHDYVDVSITSKEETSKHSCPNDDYNFHSALEPLFETSLIEVFDHDSSYHRDH